MAAAHPTQPSTRVPPGQGVTRGWPVLHVGDVPGFDAGTWRLQVKGALARPLTLSWSELLDLPQQQLRADMHCVTGWSRLDNLWRGVSLRELAARAAPDESARFVRFSDGAHYDTSVPLELALEGDALLAHSHDGRALQPEHGGPLRSVVPRLYAWKSCKWVREVEFLAQERLGFWELRGYHNDADPWREQRLV